MDSPPSSVDRFYLLTMVPVLACEVKYSQSTLHDMAPEITVTVHLDFLFSRQKLFPFLNCI